MSTLIPRIKVGTESYLSKLSTKTGEIAEYYRDFGFVGAIAIDQYGIKWIGGNGSLTRFDGENRTVFNSGFPGNYKVTSIAIDDQGNKWIGTADGLAKFDGQNWSFFHPVIPLCLWDLTCLW